MWYLDEYNAISEFSVHAMIFLLNIASLLQVFDTLIPRKLFNDILGNILLTLLLYKDVEISFIFF